MSHQTLGVRETAHYSTVSELFAVEIAYQFGAKLQYRSAETGGRWIDLDTSTPPVWQFSREYREAPARAVA